MNIDQIKAMLKLTAVQNLSPSGTASNGSTSSFQDILNELLTDAEVAALSQPISSASSPSAAINNGALSSSSASSIAGTSLPPLSLLKMTGNYDQLINKAAEQYHIPAKLIKSVVQQESSFNPNAVSSSGAAGLMQLMPGTARALGVENAFDPEQNILAGSKYLKQMLDKYNGNIELALAAYNAGSANVDKYGGIPPFSETTKYVQNIMSSYNS